MKFEIGDRVIVIHRGYSNRWHCTEDSWVDTGIVEQDWSKIGGAFQVKLDTLHYWVKANNERVWYSTITTDSPTGYEFELDVIDKVKKICSTESKTTRCNLPRNCPSNRGTGSVLERLLFKVKALWA